VTVALLRRGCVHDDIWERSRPVASLPSMTAMRRRLGLLAAMLVAVAGCGGDSHSAARKRATSTGSAAPVSAARRRCTEPGVRAQAVRFRTSDGVVLSGAVVGSGPVGAC
jgi:hypothetical protein